MENKKTEERLTSEEIRRFLADKHDAGRSKGTLCEYQRYLNGISDYLPEGKAVNASTGEKWIRHLEQQGVSKKGIDKRISVWNSLMQYWGHPDWRLNHISCEAKEQPELTRAEYLNLLLAARRSGQRRTYLLIKTLGSAGIRTNELDQLTVGAVRRGFIRLEYSNGRKMRELYLPGILKKELMDYIQKAGIESGPVFITRTGMPLDRINIYHSIRNLCQDALVPEEKANPRCLWRMYQNTRGEIQENLTLMGKQIYEQQLEHEQLIVAWNGSAADCVSGSFMTQMGKRMISPGEETEVSGQSAGNSG